MPQRIYSVKGAKYLNMKYYLGIEFGSTRIKAVKIDENCLVVASGDFTWASRKENGIWTYDLEDAIEGLRVALNGVGDVSDVAAMGISGMMHGHLAFDENWNLLTPFRTWQNTVTAEAADILTKEFNFNIPQRWSVAHLYQAILNGEPHVKNIAHITTLAGYIHYLLTGVNAVGVGEASGIFPVDKNCNYNEDMLKKFDILSQRSGFDKPIKDLLPEVLPAGAWAGKLTEEGARLTGGILPVGIPFAPPEGDMGTGMVATNSVTPRTGNVSAGTSINAMVVLERPLKKVYGEVDVVTTPSGKFVAMVHCNNCTTDSNAWISVLGEAASLFGGDTDGELYSRLYKKSLEGAPDCGGVLVCNYISGESMTSFTSGRPMVIRTEGADFTLANLMRSTLYSTMATLKIGMDILYGEGVAIDSFTGHGGLFKTEGVCQKYLAAAFNAPVSCMTTAGEGGPYGMAVLAAFCDQCEDGTTLEHYLADRVFKDTPYTTVEPDEADVRGFAEYMKLYKKLLKVERTAVESL